LLSSEEGYGRMFVYENNNYRVITSSVVMGAIANADSLNIKPYLLSEFVNYFIGYNPVTNLHENIEQLVSGEAFPNPFSNETTIAFNLSSPGVVVATVFDINGRLVKHLMNEPMKQGKHTISWDATNNDNRAVKNGFYLCRLQIGNDTKTHRLILLQ